MRRTCCKSGVLENEANENCTFGKNIRDFALMDLTLYTDTV